MIKKLIVSTIMLPITGFAVASTPLTYGKPAKLTGTMEVVRSTHPNPEYKGERQPAIRLDKPISVIIDTYQEDDIDDTEKNVKLIQLFSAEKRNKVTVKNVWAGWGAYPDEIQKYTIE